MMEDMLTEQNGNFQTKIVNDCCNDQLMAKYLNSQYLQSVDHKAEMTESNCVLQAINSDGLSQNLSEINFLYANPPPLFRSVSIIITNQVLLI